MIRIASVLLLISSFWLTSGCSSTDGKDLNSARGLFEYAEELEKDELYEQSLQKYAEVRNKHPYSKYAIRAELKIADVHYKRESYEEAQVAYQVFKDLHPKHKQIAYVTFRLALCYYHRLPDTIDRDLSQADRAILYFDEVTTNYPKSKFAKEAKEKRKEVRNRLAEKELYIGDFYFIRDVYDSALLRYKNLIANFSDTEVLPTAYLRAGISALEEGEKKEGKEYLNFLIKKYPNTEEAADARSARDKYGI